MRYLAARQVTLALLIGLGGTSATLDQPASLRPGLSGDAAATAAPSSSASVVPPVVRAEVVRTELAALEPLRPAIDGASEPGPVAASTPLAGPFAAASATMLRGAKAYAALIAREARQQGVPPDIVDGVVHVESGYNPLAVGTVGEVGLMQIRPETARMLGFSGATSDLFEPGTNVRYAAAYLAGAWRLAKGDLCRTLMKYRAGHGEERMSTLSVEYCRRVRAHLQENGSPLAQAILPKADFISPNTGSALFLTTAPHAATSSLSAMAMWRRPGQSPARPQSAGSRPGSAASPTMAYIEANRTPAYRAWLRGRS